MGTAKPACQLANSRSTRVRRFQQSSAPAEDCCATGPKPRRVPSMQFRTPFVGLPKLDPNRLLWLPSRLFGILNCLCGHQCKLMMNYSERWTSSCRQTLIPEPHFLNLKHIIYTLHPTPYTLHSAPYTLHPLPYTLHPTPYTLQPTPLTLHPTPHNLQPTTCTLLPTPCTLHPAPCTLPRSPYTFHPTPYTLHPAHFTLHAKPYTIHLTP